MSARLRWVGPAVVLVVFVLIITATVLQVGEPENPVQELTLGDRVAPFSFAMMAVVAAIVTWRRPDHVFGWLILAFALTLSISGSSTAIVNNSPDGSAAVDVFAWLSSWAWLPGIELLAISLLVFPDGHLPSRRWRHVLRLQVLGLAMAGAMAVALWPHRGPELAVVEDDWPGAAAHIGGLALPIVAVGFVAALVSLVLRYRSATTIVRLQLKWLILAVALLASALILAAVVDVLGLQDDWWDVFGIAGLFFLPIAIGFAVLKYRLFEIDRILSRTVSYALLTGVLVGVYAVGVLGIGALLPGERSDLLVAGSTLAVAALFRPLRTRIQSAVDRRFNRARFDAARTLEHFSTQLRDEIESESLQHDLCGLVSSTFGTQVVVTWTPSASA